MVFKVTNNLHIVRARKQQSVDRFVYMMWYSGIEIDILLASVNEYCAYIYIYMVVG